MSCHGTRAGVDPARIGAAGVPTTSVRFNGVLRDFMTLNPYARRHRPMRQPSWPGPCCERAGDEVSTLTLSEIRPRTGQPRQEIRT